MTTTSKFHNAFLTTPNNYGFICDAIFEFYMHAHKQFW